VTRQRVYEIIEKPKDGDRASAVFDWFLKRKKKERRNNVINAEKKPGKIKY